MRASKKTRNLQLRKPRIFLFGGAKGIGNWFATRILLAKVELFDIYLCDVATPRTIPPGSPFYWQIVDYKDGTLADFEQRIESQDIIILSVPISALHKLVDHLKKHISGSPQVVNFSSVQGTTNSLIASELPSSCAVYGLHMLFGPGVSHPAGNNAVITDLGKNENRDDVKEFLKIVSDSGMFLEYTSSQKHDDMMQILQVGIHFTFFGFANYIMKSQIDFSELLKYRTLPAGFFLSFMARALSQPKLTYANIQLQAGADEARTSIISALEELHSGMKSTLNPEKIEETLRNIANYFKPDDLQEGVAATQVAVQATELASRQLHDAVKEQRLVGLSTINDRTEHLEIRIGYILSEKRGYIEFDNRLKEISPIDGYNFVLFRTNASVEHFKKHGLQFRKDIVKLSKKKVSFLTPEYIEQWIRDNVARARTSFPITFFRFEPEVVKRLQELIPLKLPSIEQIQFDKFYFDDDMNVNAVCYVVFDATVSALEIKTKVLTAISSVAVQPNSLPHPKQDLHKSPPRPSDIHA